MNIENNSFYFIQDIIEKEFREAFRVRMTKEEKDGAGSNIATKSQFKSPEHFPPVVVDNFFKDPGAIVDYGKSLPKENTGRQPGLRSKQLWAIDDVLHTTIIKKALSCYYDLDYVSLTWQNSNMSFHEIPRFSEDKNDIINKGWIHQDGGLDVPTDIAGLIYLTPDIDPDSGTSLWSLKPNAKLKIQADSFYDPNDQKWHNEDGSGSNGDEYRKLYLEQQKSLEEKLRFQNIFNRMIIYDTMEWHAANNYYHEDGKDPRLTLAFFIGGIESDSEYPLSRIKSEEFDSIIADAIGHPNSRELYEK